MTSLIAHMRELLKAAVDGPWEFGRTSEDRRMVLGGKERTYVCSVQIHQTPRHMGQWEEPRREATAELIVALRNNADALLDQLDALETDMKIFTAEVVRISERLRKIESAAKELVKEWNIYYPSNGDANSILVDPMSALETALAEEQ